MPANPMAVSDDAILPINDVSFHPSMFFPALRMQHGAGSAALMAMGTVRCTCHNARHRIRLIPSSIRGNSIQTRPCRKTAGSPQIGESTVGGLNRKHADDSGTRIEAVQEFPVRADGNIDI